MKLLFLVVKGQRDELRYFLDKERDQFSKVITLCIHLQQKKPFIHPLEEAVIPQPSCKEWLEFATPSVIEVNFAKDMLEKYFDK